MTDAITMPTNLEGVRALLRTAGLPAGDLEDETPAWAVERDGETVGCVALEVYEANGFLRSLAVAPSARGDGLGSRLVEVVEDAARDLGLEAVYLLTTTAERFFEARGYRRIDRAEAPESIRRSSEFVFSCSASARCLGKPLSP